MLNIVQTLISVNCLEVNLYFTGIFQDTKSPGPEARRMEGFIYSLENLSRLNVNFGSKSKARFTEHFFIIEENGYLCDSMFTLTNKIIHTDK